MQVSPILLKTIVPFTNSLEIIWKNLNSYYINKMKVNNICLDFTSSVPDECQTTRAAFMRSNSES
jgi:hypothetical protein